MSATCENSLWEAFKQVPDPRKRRGVRHPFHALLTLAATAFLAGVRSVNAIGDFGRDHPFSFYLAHVHGGEKHWLCTSEDWNEVEDFFCRTSLQEVLPTGRRHLFYLFDFGDYWTFEIRKSRRVHVPEPRVRYPRVIERRGPDPEQYPSCE